MTANTMAPGSSPSSIASVTVGADSYENVEVQYASGSVFCRLIYPSDG